MGLDKNISDGNFCVCVCVCNDANLHPTRLFTWITTTSPRQQLQNGQDLSSIQQNETINMPCTFLLILVYLKYSWHNVDGRMI